MYKMGQFLLKPLAKSKSTSLDYHPNQRSKASPSNSMYANTYNVQIIQYARSNLASVILRGPDRTLETHLIPIRAENPAVEV
jgi:hypothetical protein